jgi:CTP-dependent riboflavin kinase
MELLPGILVSILRGNPWPGQGHGTMYIIIKQPHAYLQETLRTAFEGQQNVQVIVDRRYGERRTTRGSVAVERRQADRRRSREHLVEVILTEEFFGAGPPR